MLYGNARRNRRGHQLNRIDTQLADAERLLAHIFENDSHYRFDRGALYNKGRIAIQQIASAREESGSRV